MYLSNQHIKLTKLWHITLMKRTYRREISGSGASSSFIPISCLSRLNPCLLALFAFCFTLNLPPALGQIVRRKRRRRARKTGRFTLALLAQSAGNSGLFISVTASGAGRLPAPKENSGLFSWPPDKSIAEVTQFVFWYFPWVGGKVDQSTRESANAKARLSSQQWKRQRRYKILHSGKSSEAQSSSWFSVAIRWCDNIILYCAHFY